MSALLSLVLPALVPAGIDIAKEGFKGLWQKLFGGTKPVTVDDQVKLMNAQNDARRIDIERLNAIAKLDQPSQNISRWVADLRASFRYIAAGIIILGTVVLACMYFYMVSDKPEYQKTLFPVLMLFAELSGSVFSFMFGDRVYFHLKRELSGG